MPDISLTTPVYQKEHCQINARRSQKHQTLFGRYFQRNVDDIPLGVDALDVVPGRVFKLDGQLFIVRTLFRKKAKWYQIEGASSVSKNSVTNLENVRLFAHRVKENMLQPGSVYIMNEKAKVISAVDVKEWLEQASVIE
jgi:hypothetical protein